MPGQPGLSIIVAKDKISHRPTRTEKNVLPRGTRGEKNERAGTLCGQAKAPFTILDHSDERGFSFSLENLPLRDCHIVSLRPGTARGDHVHEYVEVALVIGGAGCAEIELGDEEDVSKFMVDRDFYPVTFPARVKHTIRNVGRKDFFLFCFSSDDPGQ